MGMTISHLIYCKFVIHEACLYIKLLMEFNFVKKYIRTYIIVGQKEKFRKQSTYTRYEPMLETK